MKKSIRKIYRRMLSTKHSEEAISKLDNKDKLAEEFRFNFVPAASLTLISSTFFIGLISYNPNSAGLINNIFMFMSIVFFFISISMNSWFCLMFFLIRQDDRELTDMAVLMKVNLYVMLKLTSFISPALGMLFLIGYHSIFAFFLSIFIFFFIILLYQSTKKRIYRRAGKIKIDDI